LESATTSIPASTITTSVCVIADYVTATQTTLSDVPLYDESRTITGWSNVPVEVLYVSTRCLSSSDVSSVSYSSEDISSFGVSYITTHLDVTHISTSVEIVTETTTNVVYVRRDLSDDENATVPTPTVTSVVETTETVPDLTTTITIESCNDNGDCSDVTVTTGYEIISKTLEGSTYEFTTYYPLQSEYDQGRTQSSNTGVKEITTQGENLETTTEAEVISTTTEGGDIRTTTQAEDVETTTTQAEDVETTTQAEAINTTTEGGDISTTTQGEGVESTPTVDGSTDSEPVGSASSNLTPSASNGTAEVPEIEVSNGASFLHFNKAMLSLSFVFLTIIF
jgi:hypothetical protein